MLYLVILSFATMVLIFFSIRQTAWAGGGTGGLAVSDVLLGVFDWFSLMKRPCWKNGSRVTPMAYSASVVRSMLLSWPPHGYFDIVGQDRTADISTIIQAKASNKAWSYARVLVIFLPQWFLQYGTGLVWQTRHASYPYYYSGLFEVPSKRLEKRSRRMNSLSLHIIVVVVLLWGIVFIIVLYRVRSREKKNDAHTEKLDFVNKWSTISFLLVLLF